MEVEIISSHSIKPSSPTPKHLKTHKLSLLDQFVPPIYIPMVLFYTFEDDQTKANINDTISQRLVLLKQSLSETLTHFYPFAGRIKDTLSVDCNDEGVHYVEAKVNSTLIEFFSQPNVVSYIHKLFPNQPKWENAAEGSHVAMVQVNCFTCGGIAVSASVSHMIADGAAAIFFLKSWGAAARGAVGSNRFPNFDAPQAIFPQNKAAKDFALSALIGSFMKTGKCVTRRFGFDAENIAKLSAKASSSTVGNPTRVEAVSALMWKCIMGSLKAKYGSEKTTLATHAVNMRRRVIPQFPDSYMGNILWTASVLSEKEMELPNLVIKFREAISKINSEFVKSLEGEGGSLKYVENVKEMIEAARSGSNGSDGVEYINYTSWSNFGLYDIDFGWGKPAWVTSCGSSGESAFVNTVLLMDTPSGDGIEAWIYLEEDVVAIIEHDKELLAFATVDPNPLELDSPVSRV